MESGVQMSLDNAFDSMLLYRVITFRLVRTMRMNFSPYITFKYSICPIVVVRRFTFFHRRAHRRTTSNQ